MKLYKLYKYIIRYKVYYRYKFYGITVVLGSKYVEIPWGIPWVSVLVSSVIHSPRYLAIFDTKKCFAIVKVILVGFLWDFQCYRCPQHSQ